MSTPAPAKPTRKRNPARTAPPPSIGAWVGTAQVCKALNVSLSTLTRMVRDNQFPTPIRLGRQLRWRESVVSDHLRSLEAQAAS